ncbi:MAG TPA: nucleotide sugar dehydrogenase [Methanospirillum sp.]|nr:nucleotide sugar dehydrogenase [Methanospirillum sp.]
MKICVYGLWHLGCVTSACLAQLGHEVIGLDLQTDVIDDLKHSKPPVFEPGLEDLIRTNQDSGTLRFTPDPYDALHNAAVLWVTFDTPVDDEDNADVQSVLDAFDLIAGDIIDGALIIFSSQLPVGTTRLIYARFHDSYPEMTCYFAYSPENLKLGKALQAFLDPDRIVIGTLSDGNEIFSPFFSSISEHLIWMSLESAEMTKHAINAFLATSVTFANEIASICEYVGANAKEVETGLKSEERIGKKAYLGPGNAFSGGTLGRDITFLQKTGERFSFPAYLLHSVTESNNYHKTWICRTCITILGNLYGKCISILGLTYKPGTNTLRRSLAVELCVWLKRQGAIVTAFDPAIIELPLALRNIFSLSANIVDCVSGAEVVIIATEWPEFRDLFRDTVVNGQGQIIIDPTGFLEKTISDYSNIHYYSVGRPFT